MGYAFVEIGDIETPSDAEAARQNLVKRFNRHLWAVHREFAHENTGGAMKKVCGGGYGRPPKIAIAW